MQQLYVVSMAILCSLTTIFIIDEIFKINKTNKLNNYAQEYGEVCYRLNNLTIYKQGEGHNSCFLSINNETIEVQCEIEDNKTKCGLILRN